MFLGPVWCYLLPVPLVVQIVSVTWQQGQGPGVRMNCQAFVVLTVVDLMGLTVVLPGALDHSHLTPGDLDSVRALCLDTPFSIGQLALVTNNNNDKLWINIMVNTNLCIEKHQLVSSTSMTSTHPNGRWRMSSHCINTSFASFIFQLAPELIWRKFGIFVKHVISDLVHEPVKTLALHSLLHGKLFRNISVVNQSCKRFSGVKELFVLIIKPNLNDSFIISESCRNALKLPSKSS